MSVDKYIARGDTVIAPIDKLIAENHHSRGKSANRGEDSRNNSVKESGFTQKLCQNPRNNSDKMPRNEALLTQ
jgi:hypothetical protein